MNLQTNSELCWRAEQISRLEEQAVDIKSDIKAAYAAAASAGFNPTALKSAIKVSKLDADKRATFDAAQSDLLLYLDELEGRNKREAA